MSVPVVDVEKCTGCGECIDACPSEAIALNEDKAKIDPNTCAECMACIDICPTEAICEPA